MRNWELKKGKFTLHGLGFVQADLSNGNRLHVWHPLLPKRSCHQHSSAHTHRFSFKSKILRGALVNVRFVVRPSPEGDFIGYLHEGSRGAHGGRPWIPQQRCHLLPVEAQKLGAGDEYSTEMHAVHTSTSDAAKGTATLLTKTAESDVGAMSFGRYGVKIHEDFNQFQIPEKELADIVFSVLFDI